MTWNAPGHHDTCGPHVIATERVRSVSHRPVARVLPPDVGVGWQPFVFIRLFSHWRTPISPSGGPSGTTRSTDSCMRYTTSLKRLTPHVQRRGLHPTRSPGSRPANIASRLSSARKPMASRVSAVLTRITPGRRRRAGYRGARGRRRPAPSRRACADDYGSECACGSRGRVGPSPGRHGPCRRFRGFFR